MQLRGLQARFGAYAGLNLDPYTKAHFADAEARIKKALEATDLKARLYVQGLAPVGNTPEQMGRAMKEETALWARVVKERQIRVK